MHVLLTVPRSLMDLFVMHAFLSVLCSLVVTCWERAGILAHMCVKYYCVFVTFPCGVLGQVWYLIVSLSDMGLLYTLIIRVDLKGGLLALLCVMFLVFLSLSRVVSWYKCGT